MLVLRMKAALKRRLKSVDPIKVSWTSIDREMAEEFGYRMRDVTAIRKQFFESEGAVFSSMRLKKLTVMVVENAVIVLIIINKNFICNIYILF